MEELQQRLLAALLSLKNSVNEEQTPDAINQQIKNIRRIQEEIFNQPEFHTLIDDPIVNFVCEEISAYLNVKLTDKEDTYLKFIIEVFMRILLARQNLLFDLIHQDLNNTVIDENELKNSFEKFLELYKKVADQKILDPSLENQITNFIENIFPKHLLNKRKHSNEVENRKQLIQQIQIIRQSREHNTAEEFLEAIKQFFISFNELNDYQKHTDSLVYLINQIMQSKDNLSATEFEEAIQQLEEQGALRTQPVMLVGINALKVSWYLKLPVENVTDSLIQDLPKFAKTVFQNFNQANQVSNGLLNNLFKEFLDETIELAIFALSEDDALLLFNESYSTEQGAYAKNLEYLAAKIGLLYRYGEKYIDQANSLCEQYIATWQERFPNNQANDNYFINQFIRIIGILSQIYIYKNNNEKALKYLDLLNYFDENSNAYLVFTKTSILEKTKSLEDAKNYYSQHQNKFDSELQAAFNYHLSNEEIRKNINSKESQALLKAIKDKPNPMLFMNFYSTIIELNKDRQREEKEVLFKKLVELSTSFDSNIKVSNLKDYIYSIEINFSILRIKSSLFSYLDKNDEHNSLLDEISIKLENLLNNVSVLDRKALNTIKRNCQFLLNTLHQKIYDENIADLKEKPKKFNEILIQSIKKDPNEYYNQLLKKYKDIPNNLLDEIYSGAKYIVQLLAVPMVREEEEIAHYLRVVYAEKLLFSDQRSNQPSKMQMGNIVAMNDPTEGKVLFTYLGVDCIEKHYETNEYQAFISCFTFNHDHLTQFRLYGKQEKEEATGVSLVFKGDFFDPYRTAIANTYQNQGNLSNKDSSSDGSSTTIPISFNTQGEKYPLYRCIYIDPETQEIISLGHRERYTFFRAIDDPKKAKEDADQYANFYKHLLEAVQLEMSELESSIATLIKRPTTLQNAGKIPSFPASSKDRRSNLKCNECIKNNTEKQKYIDCLHDVLLELRYLIKHVAFKEEQECRMLSVEPLTDNKKIQYESENGRMYIEAGYAHEHITKIYFGPKAKNMALFRDRLKKEGFKIKCKKSTAPLL